MLLKRESWNLVLFLPCHLSSSNNRTLIRPKNDERSGMRKDSKKLIKIKRVDLKQSELLKLDHR